MRFLKRDAPREVVSKQPETFVMAVDKYHNHPEYKVRIKHSEKMGTPGGFVADLALRDIGPIKDNMEVYLQETYGGGHFSLTIINAAHHELCTYPLSISNAPMWRPFKKKQAEDGEDGEGKRRGGSGALAERLLEKFLDKMGGLGSSDDLFKEMALKQMDTTNQTMATFYNNALVEKEGGLEQALQVIELADKLKPNIPAEDTNVAMIQALAPLLLQFLAGRMGGGAPAAGNGGLSVQAAAQQLLQSVPPSAIAALPPEQQAALRQFAGTAPVGAEAPGVALPRPGAEAAEQPQPGIAGAGSPGSAAATHPGPPAPPPPAANPQHAMIDNMIGQIRSAMRAGATDEAVAEKFIWMDNFARGCDPGDPHPMLKGILTATPETTNAEFMRFCAGIQEFRDDPGRIERVGIEILTQMGENAYSTIEQMNRGVSPGTEEGGETPSEFREGAEVKPLQEEQVDDVSGPAGIPEQPGADGVEPVPDSDPGADIDQRAADTAQAV